MTQESIEDIAGKQNYYASHLADVNKQMDVVSTEDIYNKNGVLIVPKGMRINNDVARKILGHNLENPLEEQVRLGESITQAKLQADIEALLARYQDLHQIHVRNYFDKPFDNLLAKIKLSPILFQKLTVLQKQMPKEYDKSLFCGWLAALIAYEMHLETQYVAHAFIAGLVHDIGLLNVSPDILNKREALTPEEWRAIQSHVVVGRMVLASMRTLHPSVATAVLEHHERCDGSGYPVGKTEENLTVLGQIVAMADSMQSIRINQFEKTGRILRDALPYLHMNATIHFQSVYQAMCAVLKKSGLSPTAVNPFDTTSRYVAHLLKRGLQLNKMLAILEPMVQMTARYKDQRKCAMKLWKVTQPLAQMIYSSGLLADSFMDWLHKLGKDHSEVPLHELCEVELMQNELYWQIKKLDKSIDECLEENGLESEPASRQALELFSGRLKEILEA
ncbi:MAG: hypothetical protein BM485_09625 [Desulfobulbaceae bacterium DB1]|nr:MAG: hypothetical protein BM485_09625 [Desulfobulbaceae bacterium DB1]